MPDTGERLARLEEATDRIEQKLDDFISAADKRYAGKPSEWIVYGLVAIMLVFLVKNVLDNAGSRQQQVNQTPPPSTTSQVSPSGVSTPSASVTSTAQATPPNSTASDSQSSGGGITVPLPKL